MLEFESHCRLLWARGPVCGLLLRNVVLLSDKVVPMPFLLSLNVVSNYACLWAGPFLLLGRYS